MKKFSLNGEWTLKFKGEELLATVPGSLYNDLLENDKMKDPYWRDNELEVRLLSEEDSIYEKKFILEEDFFENNSSILRCEGLDTIADIFINDQHIGYADNMHRIWEFPLNCLKIGENSIKIKLHSPVNYIRKKGEIIFADGTPDAMVGFPHIRKAHCMFGWDWGARLPDMGIWRDIYILNVPDVRFLGVKINQKHANGEVLLNFEPELNTANSDCTIEYKLTCNEGKEFFGNPITINEPKLWWPNGLGRQPLYTLTATLLKDGQILDTWCKRIGLRDLTISREKDEYGEEFCYKINGKKIFAMGADYIPEDSIFPKMNPARTRRLLEDCVLANMNSVRIWGGGFYPDNYFFDICDELGLIVWQDFMFCCAVYELDLEFEKNIKAEITDNVRRLRHHASLGLWCGNNEMEWHLKIGIWKPSPAQYSAYFRMYEHIFPELLRELDPNTFYWPASPSSGGGFDEPNDPNRGDVHYWSVWHGNKPFSDYRNYFFRFASEFGFQSFPSLSTIESFTLPEDRNIFSYVMEKHQRNQSANGKIVHYLSQTFLYPNSFEGILYASQLLQAEAIKYGVEHWRRNRGRCMGAIYWQLNDCWPVASWASIDYFGRWKALHYFAKRFFAPILLSAEEEGIITQNTNINAEHFDIKKSVRLSVSNETLGDFAGEIRWALRLSDASVIKSGSFAVNVPSLCAVWADKMDFQDADLFANYFSYELVDSNGEYISDSTVLFSMPKHFKFIKPNIQLSISGDTITVKSDVYARLIELYSNDPNLLLSDNYFDLSASERKIKILRGNVANIKARSVYDIR